MVRASKYLGSLAFLACSVVAKEIEVDEVKAAELYDSGVVHRNLIETKTVGYGLFINNLSVPC